MYTSYVFIALALIAVIVPGIRDENETSHHIHGLLALLGGHPGRGSGALQG